MSFYKIVPPLVGVPPKKYVEDIPRVQGEVHAKLGPDPSSSVGGEWRQTNKQTNTPFCFIYIDYPTVTLGPSERVHPLHHAVAPPVGRPLRDIRHGRLLLEVQVHGHLDVVVVGGGGQEEEDEADGVRLASPAGGRGSSLLQTWLVCLVPRDVAAPASIIRLPRRVLGADNSVGGVGLRLEEVDCGGHSRAHGDEDEGGEVKVVGDEEAVVVGKVTVGRKG